MLWGRFISGCWRDSDGNEERRGRELEVLMIEISNFVEFFYRKSKEKSKKNSRIKGKTQGNLQAIY
jgi:hypothetical protein